MKSATFAAKAFERRRRRPAKPWPILSVAGLVLGYHISLDLGISGNIVPNVLGSPFGLLLLLIHHRRIPGRAAAIALSITLLYFLSGLSAAIVFDRDLSIFLPAGMFVYSVLGVYGLALDFTLWKSRDLARFAFIGLCALLVGATIEVLTPLKMVTIEFSDWLARLSGHREILEDDTIRDMEVFGGYRPVFFTSEPSFLACSISLFCLIWFFTAGPWSLKRFFLLCAFSVFALLLVRSPFAILPVIVASAQLFYQAPRSKAERSKKVAFISVALLPIMMLATYFGAELFAARISLAASGADWSVIVRTYGSVAVGWNAALSYPVLGVGPGNMDDLASIQRETLRSFGVPDYVLYAEYFNRTLNNGVGAILSFFGFIGGGAYFVLVAYLLKSVARNLRWGMIATLILIACVMSGAIYSPKHLWPLVLLAAIAGASPIGRMPR